MKEKAGLLILYASETGNSLDAAERIGREAERMGCSAVVLSMDEYNPSHLPDEETVIFVVSTTGQGDAPNSMREFWKSLLQKKLGHDWLEGVHYAVFGLGDSGYEKFNVTAKKLDKRLSDLGANPILDRGLGDEQHPSGYEGALDPWLSSLWSNLYQMNPMILPGGVQMENGGHGATKTLDNPKFQVIYHDADKIQSQSSYTSDLDRDMLQIERARLMSPGKFGHEKSRPHCFLQMIKNQQLTKEGCGKDVRHFEFEALSQEITYRVGDVLEILPRQDPDSVEAFIQRCNLDPDLYISVQPKAKGSNPVASSKKVLGGPIKLRTFVELMMDVASASPRRYFFEIMSYFATAEHEKERLQYFASPEGRDDLYQYNQKERRTILEVLEDFPSVQMPFEWLVQLVPPLRTRAFSISSSPSAHPNQVHLTVSVVSWTTPFKRKRSGLCSTWLAGLHPQESVHIPVWFNRGLLPPPPPSLPLILIGPGTGCAPFRGFIEERALQSASTPTAPVLFFFGCRTEDDFLYRDFWLSHSENNGVLAEIKGGGFFVAFSRNQPQKVYVQHKMEEERQRVWSLLSAGAAIYIAGSSTNMPADVSSCIETIVSKESGVPRESALRWLRALERAGRYFVEAWS